jgi:peptide/nickel transport system permease protein/peptide/nickel transport system substrate-binding protein
MPEEQHDTTPRSSSRVTRRQALAIASAAVAALASDRGARAEGVPKKGGVLRVSSGSNPSSLDPTTGGSGADHAFLYPMFDTLMEWDYEQLKSMPGLATAWKYPDPKTLVIDLRDGVRFHDGAPFDADAVKLNLDRNKTSPRSNVKADLETVAAIEVTGPMQVTLRLSTPDSALPGILSDRAGMMMSPAAIKSGDNLDRKPVGSGAYTFVSWSDGDKVIVKSNEAGHWRADRNFLDGIEFAIIPELATGVRSVTSGEKDFMVGVPARQKVVVERSSAVQVVTGTTLGCAQFYLNWAKPPFDDIRVRQAMNYAIDRESYAKVAYAGLAEPAAMNLPRSHWAYDAELAKLYPFAPDKARQLLAEAGHGSGLAIDFVGNNDQDSIQREEILIEQLRKVGITAKFTNGTVAAIAAGFFGPDKRGAAQLSAWTGRPDPSQTYASLYTKDAYYNAGRAEVVPELTSALADSRSTEDIEARKKAFAKLQRALMENAYVVPLVFPLQVSVMSTRVKGYRPNLLGKPKFEHVWIES